MRRIKIDLLVIIDGAVVVLQDDMYMLLTGSKELEPHSTILALINVEHEVLAGVLYHAHLLIRHEILCEALLLIRHKPGEVRLVLGVREEIRDKRTTVFRHPTR